MKDIAGIFIFLGAVIVLPLFLYGYYRLLHSRGPIGSFVRIIWNLGWQIVTIIPGLGGFSFLIVEMDDEDIKADKERRMKEAEEYDKRQAEARRQAEADYQEQIRRAEQNRRDQEESLRADAYRKYGTRDVHLNSDGSRARIGDGDWVPTHELEKDLRS